MSLDLDRKRLLQKERLKCLSRNIEMTEMIPVYLLMTKVDTNTLSMGFWFHLITQSGYFPIRQIGTWDLVTVFRRQWMWSKLNSSAMILGIH